MAAKASTSLRVGFDTSEFPTRYHPILATLYHQLSCTTFLFSPQKERINISIVLAGQKLGLKEVDDGIWLVSFMHYDLGYFELEQKTLQPLDNPFGTRLSPMS